VLSGIQLQTEIAVATTSSAEHEWYRGAVSKLVQLDRAWLAVLLCYCAVFGGILLYSNFLPYTFDNNESFSTFWRAREMYEYGIANSSGLPDKSFSYNAAAHRSVYTHAGASPQLFAYLLYVLGIRTVQLQVAVTVFTVGLLSFWFAYRFLAEISTRLHATIACLVLMTDYIMFARWHVGLWHVWKMFLLFGGLYLAQRVASRKQACPLLIVYAFHTFLFYYETIFNVYVAAAVFLYFVFASRDYGFAFKFGVAQVAGALTAAAILLGRNFATDPATFLEAAWAFYAQHNIVFWLNVPDSGTYRSLLWALRVLFLDHAAHTPPWSLVVLAFAAAEIIRRLRSGRATAGLSGLFAPAFFGPSKSLARTDWQLLVNDTAVLAPFMLVALTGAVFYILASHPEIGAGFAPLPSFWLSELLPVAVGAGILAVTVAMLWLFWTFELWPIVRRSGILAFAVPFQACTKLFAVLSRAFATLFAVLSRAFATLFAVLFGALIRLRDYFDRIDSEFPGLKKPFDRIDWEPVIRDITVLARCVLVALSAAVFYILESHLELDAGLTSPLPLFELLSIVIGILAAAAIVFRRFLQRALPKLGKFFARADWKRVVKDVTIGLVLLIGATTLFFVLSRLALGHATLIGVGILCVGMVFFTPLALFAHPRRILAAGAFVAAVLAFLLVQPALYEGMSVLELNWWAALAEFAVYRTGAALLVSTMLLLAAWHASGAVARTGRGSLTENPPDRLLLVFAALLVAYLLVYFLFTGYIITGYFARYLSLTIFLNDLVLALGLVAVIDCVRGWYDRFKESTGWRRIARGAGAAAVAFGLGSVVVYWGSLQTLLLRKPPPDEIAFAPVLSKPPFRDSTFAASIYGGTLAYFNKKCGPITTPIRPSPKEA
jgi:hypothetical protein